MAAEKAHEKQNKQLLRQANKNRPKSQAAVQRSLENASEKYRRISNHDNKIKTLNRDIGTIKLKIRTLDSQTLGTENKANVQSQINSVRGKKGSVYSQQEAYRKLVNSNEREALESELQKLEESLVKEKAAKKKTEDYYKRR